MPKADYGYDAPTVIIKLILIGFAFLVAGLSPFLFYTKIYTWIIYAILAICVPMGLSFIVPALLMIWSSRFGKFMVVREMLDSLGLKGDEQVLDVGCGRGLLTISAAKKLSQGKAVGIDIWRQEDQSHNSITQTYKNAKTEKVHDRIEIKTNDMCEMQFVDNTFDAIISCLAIHNIEDSQKRQKAVREISRVVKPGGRVALLDFKNTDEYAQWLRESGWNLVSVTKADLRMFPPVRIVHATKPA